MCHSKFDLEKFGTKLFSHLSYWRYTRIHSCIENENEAAKEIENEVQKDNLTKYEILSFSFIVNVFV